MKTEPSAVMKYCPAIDEFLKIRIFAEEETAHLLRSARIPNKASYQRVVVEACIVRYGEEILPLVEDRAGAVNLEEILYQYCVEVNPNLDINRVVIPIDEAEPGEGLRLAGERSAPDREERLARLRTLEDRLRERVIGQEDAVAAVARSIRKGAVGIRDPKRPVGTFLFIGQTGVGKTELAKALADCLYGNPEQLVRIDCSEYSLPHEYAKLIGAPPGYIGHDEGGQLTEAIRKKGQAVVLFDEVEKADPKIHNILLQLLDDGILTDSKGGTVSFAECVVILTSNLGVEEVERFRSGVGFDAPRRAIPSHDDRSRETMKAVRDFFRPEFVNRLDATVVFRTLDRTDLERIARLKLDETGAYARRAAGIELEVDPTVPREVAREGYAPDLGAREIRRAVERLVETPLAEQIVAGRFGDGDRVRVRARAGRITLTRIGKPRSRQPGTRSESTRRDSVMSPSRAAARRAG